MGMTMTNQSAIQKAHMSRLIGQKLQQLGAGSCLPSPIKNTNLFLHTKAKYYLFLYEIGMRSSLLN
jgi:hypothetical protein